MNLVELLDRPIAFHRPFVELGLGITGALFLSQALYWSRRTNSSGYFYKTQEEWESETGMTRREQETARKKLKSLGILEEKKQGVPCRVFYRINDQKLLLILSQKESKNQSNPVCTETPNQYGGMRQTRMAETDTLDCTNPPSSDGGNSQTKTETTHRLPETTTEITSASSKRKAGSRKTLMPDDFKVTSEMADWYKAQTGFVLDVQSATEQWSDAMKARASKYVDWVSAWRNGMRLQNKWAAERGAQARGQSKIPQVEEFSEQTNPEDYGPPQWFLDRQDGGEQ